MPCELVQKITDALVKGLAKDPIRIALIGDDLRVRAAGVQQHRVFCGSGEPRYLQMSDTVIDTDNRQP